MKAIRYDSPEADIGTGGGPELEFGRLFDAYAAPLHRYLARRVGPDHAHDLVSETFLAAFKQRETYNPDIAAVRSWLYGIATNLARRHVRQEVRGLRATSRADNTPYQPSHDGMVADRVDAQAMARQIAPAIAELSDGDRDVLLLTSWSELTTVEVAEALGIPVGTVRSRLHRIRRQLRTHAAIAHLTATPEAIHHD
ncbi:RNA polymerase sigma factor [Kribbella sp. NPDC051718]|uniref:RNA polymerase sigma factor n=1 Tax=Kribbella sp. NPDC051718 TaxID=3155168 RepID=UPI00343F8CC4